MANCPQHLFLEEDRAVPQLEENLPWPGAVAVPAVFYLEEMEVASGDDVTGNRRNAFLQMMAHEPTATNEIVVYSYNQVAILQNQMEDCHINAPPPAEQHEFDLVFEACMQRYAAPVILTGDQHQIVAASQMEIRHPRNSATLADPENDQLIAAAIDQGPVHNADESLEEMMAEMDL